MKAAVVTKAGPHWSIEVQQLPTPEPAAGEILVRVRATTVNRTDLGEILHPLLQRIITRSAKAQRTILGMDFAGEVEAVGAGVETFKPGDRVFGMCLLRANGAQAEYVCMAESGWLAPLPAAIPFGQAVVCEGAFYANASLSRLRLPPGSPILVYGASGAIGSAAVQLARYYGFHVTAAVEPRHVAMAQSLGADRVVDIASGEYRALGKSFDFVLDAVGKMTIAQWRRLLKPDGTFAATDIGPWGQSLLALLWSMVTRSGRVVIPIPERGSGQAFVHFLKDRMEAGQYRAIVDRKIPLDQIADAYRYVQTGQKAGIVVVEV